MTSLIELESLEDIKIELLKSLHETNELKEILHDIKQAKEEMLATYERLTRELEKTKAECKMLADYTSSVGLEGDNVNSELRNILIKHAQSREAEVRWMEMSSLNEQVIYVVGVVNLSICLHVFTIMMQY